MRMRWFKNLRIGTKIIILVLIMSIFIGIVGFTGFSQLTQSDNRINELCNENLKSIEWLDESRTHMRANQAFLLEMILENNLDKQKKMEQDIQKRAEEVNKLLTNFEKTDIDTFEKEQLNLLKDAMPSYREKRTKVIELAKKGEKIEAYQVYKESETFLETSNNAFIKLAEHNSELAEQANIKNDAAARSANILLISVLIGSIITGLLLGWFISRLISKPLNTMVKGVNEIAKGNLTIEEADNVIDYHDEVGQLGKSLQIMVKNLRELITHVSEATDKVAASSEELSASTEQNKQATTQIASSIQEVSSGADTQVKEIDEVVKTMEVMSQGIQRLAETSGVVSESSKETATAAEKGNESIQNAVTKLNKQSQEIGNIVNVITGISDQTHLLALNAAIEAAHAGDLGKGFAVVASEVKKLAEQSKESANQIASLVKEVQQGMIDVQKVGEAFHDIVSKAQHVANEIEKVSASTEEMSANSQEVTASIEQMGQIAKDSASNTQNVASASEEQLASFEEITASADALGHMATELQQLISKFKV